MTVCAGGGSSPVELPPLVVIVAGEIAASSTITSDEPVSPEFWTSNKAPSPPSSFEAVGGS